MPNELPLLLETKLHPPQPRAALLMRERLADLADRVLEVPLTLVSAPAGFGKSTLLAAWHSRLAGLAAVGWVGLDESDADPEHFARYLGEAATRASAGRVHFAGPTLEALAAEIVGGATAVGLPMVLFLDDFQLAESPRVDAAIRFFVEHLPPEMHVVIGSRHDPSLQVSRMRARGRLIEVRADDLRFTEEEAAELLNGMEHLGLSPEQVTTLEMRTEGWAAALQLATLSVRGKSDPGRFIEAFSGSHRFVYDYLADEVFRAQDGDMQTFLLRTSVLDQLSGSLCDAVAQLGVSGSRLQSLNRTNLFTIALDEEGRWFRYHHLFRDFLRRQLEEHHPADLPVLHRRASEWFAGEGLVEEALPHAVAAGDEPWTVQLIEQAMPGATLSGSILTPAFDRWLHVLPRREIARRPRLALPLAFSRAIGGRIGEAAELLDQAAAVLEGQSAAPDEATTGELAEQNDAVNLARAYLARYRGLPEEALAIADRALISAGSELTRAWLEMTRQLVLFEAWRPGHEPSGAAIDVAARRCFEAGHLSGATALRVVEYYHLFLAGRLHDAERHLHKALREAYERKALPTVGMLHGALAELHYERGNLDEAEDEARQCLAFGAPGSSPGLFTPPEATLARVHAVSGGLAAAETAISLLEERVRPVETVQGRTLFPALLAHLRLVTGQVPAQEPWEPGARPAADGTRTFAGEYPALVYARLQAARGHAAGTLSLLERTASEASSAGRYGRAFEAQLLAAICRWRTGEERQALASFSDVLQFAAREGYVRTVLDEGEPAYAMLRRAAAGGPNAAYATRLLLLAGETAGGGPRSQVGPDDLSARELDVLRLLVLGSSNREIAEDLVVSLDTVKTHLRNVYGKLGAHSRTQAIVAARARGLV